VTFESPFFYFIEKHHFGECAASQQDHLLTMIDAT
jgi:hypothetical protein